ncbi:MarR family winged helix-turn-helix transcriptional regulator [Domibacillus enclensis]|uniref:DNA-binding transcriptional regulator, MarR family n=1 Tax=Domibacillus enclensis TaxID=1017273 RepID=A0A1N6Q3F3_9BACI|nr:MarR family transcriptional regulator [Domibacillus enclensis]OXS80572.1 MarR family transcriptional regulator [Domibacillus enclensis]SIQ11067.1 DNA-binding transcriptional regulator, MarR family [Domibacillus enclensis]
MSLTQSSSGEAVADIERNLRHIDGIIKQKGREILNDYMITPPQFIALHSLYEKGDTTIGDLSSRMFLACSTTTDLIDRMEKSRLVERVKDTKDRRIVRIHLLEEGENIIKDVIKRRQEYVDGVLNNFSAEETAQLNNLLNKMHIEMKAE